MRFLILLFVLSLASCGESVTSGGADGAGAAASSGAGGTSSEGGSGGLPACSWPAALDPANAAPRACTARRALLSCTDASGAGEFCLSDSLVACPDSAGNPALSCVDECLPGEYAVACGGVGPAPSVPLPTGCRGALPNPGGIGYGCCPCE